MPPKVVIKKDNLFETFIDVCNKVASVSSYISKSNVLKEFFQKGSNGKKFDGDIHLWINFLLPGASKRVYNLQNKQIVKLFSRIFKQDLEDMMIDLEQGDVSETIRKYFELSKGVKPCKSSKLTLMEVEENLVKLLSSAKEDHQIDVLTDLCKKSGSEDLKMIIRLIKQDLKMNAKARHVLDAFGPDAYPAYQSSQDLVAVIDKYGNNSASKPSPKKGVKVATGSGVQIMVPISPMLASACNSVDTAFKKNPGGLFSEIKYDGERVQIHKRDNQYSFFSRSLKPVMEHKVKRFRDIIPKAFPSAKNIVLDSEIIMVDTDTGELLPFGTLGSHKKQEHANSAACLFVFDCIYFNDKDLQSVPLRERRKILEANIMPIKCCVQLSESHFLATRKELALMTAKVLKSGMEGIVLKNPDGLYQPGKRGWLKVKKDYLFDGKMADTADLVVLGGWFGSGKKGGMLSIFLMGCQDKRSGRWKTVTKVHSGLDDATMEKTHAKLMVKMERSNTKDIPSWLDCNKPLVPDYIAKSPGNMPVWEITGAEFTNSNVHTANGISIRFPRITKIRNDKSPKEATSLKELQDLFTASKDNVNVDLLLKDCDDDEIDIDIKTSMVASPSKKIKLEISETSKVTPPIKKEDMSSDELDNDDPRTSLKRTPIKTEKVKEVSTKTPSKRSKRAIKRENSGECEDDADETTPIRPKRKQKSDIFKGFIAHFCMGADPVKRLPVCIKFFEENGGNVTLNKKKANLVLYDNDECVESITKNRANYKSDCRHLNVKWMLHSITFEELKPFADFAIEIKSN